MSGLSHRSSSFNQTGGFYSDSFSNTTMLLKKVMTDIDTVLFNFTSFV